MLGSACAYEERFGEDEDADSDDINGTDGEQDTSTYSTSCISLSLGLNV